MATPLMETPLTKIAGQTFPISYSSPSSAPAMADLLSPLNFKFEELRATMNDFTRRFDAFIEKGRRRVLEEKSQFRMGVAEVQDQQALATRNISHLQIQSSTYASALNAQITEAKEMQSQIDSLTQTRDSHLSTISTLRTRLASTKSAINTKKAAEKQERMYLDHHSSYNAPELRAWEDMLGLRIEGLGVDDRVRFVFQGLDDGHHQQRRRTTMATPNEPSTMVRSRNAQQQQHRLSSNRWTGIGESRDAFFDLDMSPSNKTGFEVVEPWPRLQNAAVEDCLCLMREKEDLGGFLKKMRLLFIQEFARQWTGR